MANRARYKSTPTQIQFAEDSGSTDWFGENFTASPTPSPAGVTPTNPWGESLPMEAHEVAKLVRFMAKREMAAANDNNVIEDWRFLALVFDRFLLFIFVSVTIVGTAVILLNTPYLWDEVDQEEIRAKWHDMHLDLMKQPGYIPE